MKLQLRRYGVTDEYRCDLTRYLDEVAKLSETEYYDLYHHYIVADELCMKEKVLAIRVPGGTVGGIWIDDHNVIQRINIDTDYVVKTYPDDVNELVKKYIGAVIEYWYLGRINKWAINRYLIKWVKMTRVFDLSGARRGKTVTQILNNKNIFYFIKQTILDHFKNNPYLN